jgi:hypothetical protein
VKSWRDAGDTPCNQTTEKRQNFDPCTPPAGTERLHFTLNGKIRRAPWAASCRPPAAHAQMAWEDADKVSLVVPRYSHRQPWPEQHSYLDRPKKMQELTDSIKRLNLRIMGIEEGEEVQVKGMSNIFNKIIMENFPNLEKDIPIQMQTDQIKIELPHDISSLKQQVQKLGKEY